ncbi:hypothetical protein N5K21_20565 [Rhizobium pusense]|uniref:hypothetical protein n=1 Tax=Agrobacterium pusense TaxID=648995 RepID=UPI0024489258|nr:hypothetical protein [Agrobacterium pusense]MDH2091129.1 hypothetical protein [Agrobacterium pusense]
MTAPIMTHAQAVDVVRLMAGFTEGLPSRIVLKARPGYIYTIGAFEPENRIFPLSRNGEVKAVVTEWNLALFIMFGEVSEV